MSTPIVAWPQAMPSARLAHLGPMPGDDVMTPNEHRSSPPSSSTISRLLVDAPHDRLDIRLLDRQIVQSVARGDVGDQLRRGYFQTIELQPTARTIGPHFSRARHPQRVCHVVGQIDYQRALGPKSLANR